MAKTLRVGLLTAVDRLDPRQPPEFAGSAVLLQVFEPRRQPGRGRPGHPVHARAFGRVPLAEG